jgi:4-nitrophenyl phosphatase
MARRVWSATRALQQYDTFIFDCDGVIWNGEMGIAGAADTLQRLHKAGKKLIFCSNNSSKSRATYTKRLRQFVGLDLSPEVMYMSAYGAAQYIKGLPTEQFDHSRQSVFVVGQKGITEELEQVNVKYVHAETVIGDRHYTSQELDELTTDPSIGAVLVGADWRFTYSKAAYAFRALARPGCLFISTNQDNTFPTANSLLPGGGCAVAMLRHAYGKEPFNIGKPSSFLMDSMIKDHSLDRSRTLMVGDKLETDILFGSSAGVDTLLVMSGVTLSEAEVHAADATMKPTYLLPSLASVFDPVAKL